MKRVCDILWYFTGWEARSLPILQKDLKERSLVIKPGKQFFVCRMDEDGWYYVPSPAVLSPDEIGSSGFSEKNNESNMSIAVSIFAGFCRGKIGSVWSNGLIGPAKKETYFSFTTISMRKTYLFATVNTQLDEGEKEKPGRPVEVPWNRPTPWKLWPIYGKCFRMFKVTLLIVIEHITTSPGWFLNIWLMDFYNFAEYVVSVLLICWLFGSINLSLYQYIHDNYSPSHFPTKEKLSKKAWTYFFTNKHTTILDTSFWWVPWSSGTSTGWGEHRERRRPTDLRRPCGASAGTGRRSRYHTSSELSKLRVKGCARSHK